MNAVAFVWDLDGTLLDSYEVIVSSLYRTYRELGVELKKEEILKDLLDDDKGKQAREAIKKNEEDWTTSAQEDMLDWIEEQGIYIRQ